jgi:hypothetical protein
MRHVVFAALVALLGTSGSAVSQTPAFDTVLTISGDGIGTASIPVTSDQMYINNLASVFVRVPPRPGDTTRPVAFSLRA